MNATTPQATLPEDLAQVADGKTLEILERRVARAVTGAGGSCAGRS